jgi:uncharacterized damage-inducible protein DinB
MIMSEKANIVENLKRLQEGNAWYGPSLRDILKNVSPEMAAARPAPGTHTIWELLTHISVWEKVFQRRLEGHAVNEPEEGDFPSTKDLSPAAWNAAKEDLESNHQKLMRTITELPDSRLNETVPGKDYPIRFMLVGLIQHHVYHAGQISLIKKLQS